VVARLARALVGVAHRCPCGQPDVVETAPRLEDGTPFPTTAGVLTRWFRGRVPTPNDFTRGIPVVDDKVRAVSQRKKAKKRTVGLESAYCAEIVAVTFEDMGLLATDKDSNWFDPGKFWSGDTLPLAPGYRLSNEIAVIP